MKACVAAVVSGDSAGGNLAAALALKLKDSEHGPRLQYQILLYPILQGESREVSKDKVKGPDRIH